MRPTLLILLALALASCKDAEARRPAPAIPAGVTCPANLKH